MRTHKRWLTVGAVLVALLLVSVIPVGAHPGTIYVDVTLGTDVALCGGNLGTDACKTIQYAIDNIAVANDTIMVAAGTYAEDLVVDKAGLELKGAGATTVIQGVQTTAWTLWPLAEPNIDILGDGVKAHDFTFKNPAWSDGYYSSGMIVGAKNVEIYNVAFQGATSDDTDDVSQCFQTWNGMDVSGLSVHHNTFTTSGTGAYGYEGIFINLGGTGAVNIHDNTFSGRVIRAITTQRQNTAIDNNTITTSLDTAHAFQGIWVDEANVTVTNNEVKGSSGFGKGIDIGHALLALHDITLTGNTVGPGNDTGIRVRGVLSGTGVEIHLNNIAGNTTFGVDASAVTGGSLDAECNWWGYTSGPSGVGTGTGDAVGSNVDFTPWTTLGLSAVDGKAEANGLDFEKITASLACGGSAVPDAKVDFTKVDFTTDFGWFTLTLMADVENNVPLVNGEAAVNLYSGTIGRAKVGVSPAGMDDWVEGAKLVTFYPEKPFIVYPLHRLTISKREPIFSWTESPAADEGVRVFYQLRLVKVRPKPRKLVFKAWTRKSSFQSPYLDGKVYLLKVKACAKFFDPTVTVCSRWAKSRFRIR